MDVVRRTVITCYLSDAILGSFFQLPIWIVYQSSFLSYSQIAFYSGLSLLVEVLAQLPTGAFADIFGRRLSLSLGNLFMALPMFLMAFYPRPEIMVWYALLWGLGRAFAMGTSKPILYETLSQHGLGSRYPQILSRSVVSFQLSAAISIAAGGYLYQLSPNLPYIFSGTVSLLGVFTAFLFIEPPKHHRFSLAQFAQTVRQGFGEIFKNTYVTKLTWLYVATFGLAQTSQQFFMQPYMVELGMGEIQRSLAAMAIKIGIALLGAWLVSRARFFSNRNFLWYIPMVLAISLLPAGFTILPWAYLVFIGIAFSSGNTDLFLSPEINRQVSSSVRSTAISLQRMLGSIVGAMAQFASVFLVATSGVGVFYSYLGMLVLLLVVPLAVNLSLSPKTE